MNSFLKTLSLLVVATGLLAADAAASVNKNIRIEAGASSDGGSTVNGNVRVGRDAVVNGKLSSVNGGIGIDSGARVGVVESVNGRINIDDDVTLTSAATVNGRNSIGERARIAAGVETVNGAITIDAGSSVGGDVSAVNGKIALSGVTVLGNVSNYNGGMELLDATRVAGVVMVKKPKQKGWSWGRQDRPRVVIGENVVIEGGLLLEREVRLYVHETADIGEITGVAAEMETFSGREP